MGEAVRGRNSKAVGKVAPLENTIVRGILCHLLRLQDGFFFKTHGNQFQTGQPDILGCYKGRAVAIEVKRPGFKPTEIQTYVLSCWSKAGAIVGCAHSLEEALAILGVPEESNDASKREVQ